MKSIYSCRKKSQKKRKSKGHHHLLQVLGLRLHHLLDMFHSRSANTSLWHWLNNTSKKSPDQMAFQISTPFSRLNSYLRISLVAQWWRIHEPMQGARVQSLIQEDPTCHRATKPVCHNYWAYALEPGSHNYWAHTPQLLKLMAQNPCSATREATTLRSPHTATESRTRSLQLEKTPHSNKDPAQPINKIIYIKIKWFLWVENTNAFTHTVHTKAFLPWADFLFIYLASSLLNAIIF